MVVDEASQLLVTQSIFIFQHLHSTNGRLVLAGDHEQLPPIIHADYYSDPRDRDREKEGAQELLLHRSIFELVQRLDTYASYLTESYSQGRLEEANALACSKRTGV